MTTSSHLAPADVVARSWGWRHAGRRAWAVSDLDLRINPGERVLLLGASGSGKSTLLAGLAGLLHGQQSGESLGELRIDGLAPHAARHRSGLVLQDPETQLVMSRAGDDVAFGPENYGVPADQIWPRVRAALDVVGFSYPLDRPTAALSGGEKQRLALAGILANRPGLLLLDEPTANLDPDGAGLIRAAVTQALDETGATAVLVEHRVGPWLPIIDRVVVLADGGGLLADGPAAQVFGQHADALRAAGVWVPQERARPRPRTAAVIPGRSEAVAPVRPVEVLTARGLRLRYPHAHRDAVTGVDLALRAGTTTAVIGANGSGKSTLALMMAGLVRPSGGSVTASDLPQKALFRRPPRSLASVLGTVFQNPEHQFLTKTVHGELTLAPRRLGWTATAAAARADELLDRLGLTALARANPFTLSGGQKRRLSVATALSAAASVLVLDEPTFGQDAHTWMALADLVHSVRADGHALLIVSHDEDFVARVADDVHVMSAGSLRAGSLRAGSRP